MKNEVMEKKNEIQSRILTIRGVQVMLDRDLAAAYQVTTSAFNQAVKRNLNRFPDGFRFQLTKEEHSSLISQSVTSKRELGLEARGGYRKLPYVFTEQGVAMLSGVLKSDVAVQTSIRIMTAFVAMRRTLASLTPLLARVEANERRQIVDQSKNEERFKEIFDAMNADKFPPQKIFFRNSVEDAHSFVVKLVKRAKREIVLVDGYVDDVTLDILAKKRKGVAVTIATHPKTALSATDVAKFNAQYPTLTLRTSSEFHDRFLILDGAELYQIGASLKDVGRRCFAIAQLEALFIPLILSRL